MGLREKTEKMKSSRINYKSKAQQITKALSRKLWKELSVLFIIKQN